MGVSCVGYGLAILNTLDETRDWESSSGDQNTPSRPSYSRDASLDRDLAPGQALPRVFAAWDNRLQGASHLPTRQCVPVDKGLVRLE